jgi:signal transduction histidine kinase
MLFDPFRQASEGFDREYSGTGLGLSIVRKLTDALGGEIEVETEKGVGSRFTIRLSRKSGGDPGTP